MDEKTIKGNCISSAQFHEIPVHYFLRTIDSILSKGGRVELIPVKDGVKVVRVRREEVKTNG
jgi:hypothetical protein